VYGKEIRSLSIVFLDTFSVLILESKWQTAASETDLVNHLKTAITETAIRN
jgi:hypothetical protein